MKKLLALILVCAMTLSLCACGGNNTEKTTAGDHSNEKENIVSIETPKKGNLYGIGQDIDTGFATMSFSAAKIVYTIGETITMTAQDGMRYFGLVGTIENTSGKELTVNNLRAEMVFNDEFTYTAYATIGGKRNSTNMTVAPLAKVEYWVYAEIPDALLDRLSFCDVNISLNDDFASLPDSVKKGDHKISLHLNEEVCKSVLQSLNVANDYFKECPILPTPTNYVPVRQSSSSSSSHNGKVTSIKYAFSSAIGRSDDVATMYQTYITELQSNGFTIQSSSGSSCEIFSDGNKLATVIVNSNNIEFDIVPGNENASTMPTGNVTNIPTISSTDTIVKIGESITTKYIDMSLEKHGSSSEIRSGSNQYGMYSYYTSENGDPYFYVYGTLKNLGGTPVDIRNIYVQFCFDEKYNYRGSVSGVSGSSDDFIIDVSPLASVNYYMYTAVPQELISNYTSCNVRIGFTENFDHKVVNVNDLPQFDRCDDVFLLKIDTAPELVESTPSTTSHSNNSINAEDPGTPVASINDGKIEIHSSPNKNSNIIGYLDENTSVEIARTESVSGIDWAYIVGDTSGWVVQSQIHGMVSDTESKPVDYSTSVVSIMKGVIAVSGLNIRDSASRDGKVIGAYNKGDIVNFHEQKDGWGRTDKGWIMLEYVNIG